MVEKTKLNLSENLRYIEEHGATFFATGSSQVAMGLDLSYIPLGKSGGVNFSSNRQNLLQSYLIAKHIFEHVKPKTIKFVLIGLSLYSVSKSSEEIISILTRDIQDNLTLEDTDKNTPPYCLM